MLGLSRRDVALLAGGTVTGALGLLAAQRLAVLLWAPKGAQAAEPALGERELAREITGLTAAIQNLAQVVTDRHLTLTAPQAPAHTHTRHAPRTAAHRHDDDDEFVLASEVLAGYDEADGGYEEASTVAHLADVSVSHVAEDSLTPTQQLLKRVDELRDEHRVLESAALILGNRLECSKTPEGLWRLCRALYDQGEADAGVKQARLEEAVPYGEKAVELTPNCAEAHKWYAVAKGAMADYVPLNEKLKCGLIFRKHVEEAIRLDPTDSLAYHLLGRWCFEVAGLSWFEKKACAALIGTPPEATYEETLEHFLKANELTPDWKLNQLFIGKTFLKLSKKADAHLWFRKCTEGECDAVEDRDAQETARSLLG